MGSPPPHGLACFRTARRVRKDPRCATNSCKEARRDLRVEESKAMHDTERERIFGEWLASHKAILFKVVRAYAFPACRPAGSLPAGRASYVWHSVEAFRGESSVPTWLYRVALNTAIAWTRKEVRHQRGKQPFEGMEGLLTHGVLGRSRPARGVAVSADRAAQARPPFGGPAAPSTASATGKSPPSSASPRATWG